MVSPTRAWAIALPRREVISTKSPSRTPARRAGGGRGALVEHPRGAGGGEGRPPPLSRGGGDDDPRGGRGLAGRVDGLRQRGQPPLRVRHDAVLLRPLGGGEEDVGEAGGL